MDEQQRPGDAPPADQQVFGTPAPDGAPEPQVVPLGEEWATSVPPVAVTPRSRRLRWAAALGIVLAVVLVTAAAAFVMIGAGSTTTSLTASLAPKDTIAFAMVRTDLPGDQHQKLADLLHTFPGFADRAQFDNALDDMFNRVTQHISPGLTYTSAIQPWFSGEISLALTKYAATSAQGDGIVLFSLKDRAKAEAWLAGEIAKSREKFADQDYAGTTIHVSQNATSASASSTGAYAFTDKALVAGTLDGVKAALDTKTKGSLADVASYQKAMKTFSGDRLASFYVDLKAFYNASVGASSSIPMPQDDLNAAVKDLSWVAGSVRADSNRLVVEMAMPKPASAPTIGNSTSSLAPELPGSTVAMFEIHSIGKLASGMLDQLDGPNGTTNTRATAKQIRDALATVGGLDWLGDTSLVLTTGGGKLGGGLVAEATDAATAQTKVDMLSNLATIGLGSASAQVRDDTYKGTTITVFNVAGASVGAEQTDFAIAAHDKLIVVGYGEQFVKDVIDTTSSSSLASKANYKAIMDAAGSSNMEAGYVDVSSLTAAYGQQIWSAMAGQNGLYASDISKYAEHIDAAALSAVEGDTTISRIVVTVK